MAKKVNFCVVRQMLRNQDIDYKDHESKVVVDGGYFDSNSANITFKRVVGKYSNSTLRYKTTQIRNVNDLNRAINSYIIKKPKSTTTTNSNPATEKQVKYGIEHYNIANGNDFSKSDLHHILTLLSTKARKRYKKSLKEQKAYVKERFGVIFSEDVVREKPQSQTNDVSTTLKEAIGSLSKEDKKQILIALLS